MEVLKAVQESDVEHECDHCGGPYAVDQAYGDDTWRLVMFKCEWCEVNNFAAVALDSEAAPSALSDDVKTINQQHRDGYPNRLSVLTVAAHIPPGFDAERIRLYHEQSGAVRISAPEGFSESEETELCCELRSPSTTVGVENGCIRVARRTGHGINYDGGNPTSGRMSANSQSQAEGVSAGAPMERAKL